MTSTVQSHGPRRWAPKSSCLATAIRLMEMEARTIGRYGFVTSTVTRSCWRVQTVQQMEHGDRSQKSLSTACQNDGKELPNQLQRIELVPDTVPSPDTIPLQTTIRAITAVNQNSSRI